MFIVLRLKKKLETKNTTTNVKNMRKIVCYTLFGRGAKFKIQMSCVRMVQRYYCMSMGPAFIKSKRE